MDMVNRTDNLNMANELSPMLLSPAGKDYLWGGVRLLDEFEKRDRLLGGPFDILAESWECSTHPDGLSYVASGPFRGKSLAEVLHMHPEYVGSHPGQNATNYSELPVLIKLIDAAKDLSIQVHPDDTYAWQKEDQPGKTEMWYVMDAAPDAQLIYGFSHDCDPEEIRSSIEKGAIGKHLKKIPVKKDDVFFIEPGTVHAIGKGVLLAEVQECSNVTYRLYDYDRVDKNGQKRPLHVEKALEVANLSEQKPARLGMRVMRYQKGAALESLCRCNYFQVDRILVSSMYQWTVEENSFQVFLVLEGKLKLKNLELKKGDCVFFPAGIGQMQIEGKGQVLKICC